MRYARGLFVVAVLVGACSSPASEVTATPSFDTVVSEAPAQGSAAPTGGPSRGPTPAGYPKNGKGYAEAILSAWRNRDLVRLADLTIPQVLDQIIGIPGPPNMNWKHIRVTSTSGVETAAFYNLGGDVIRLGISTAVLGKAHAAFKVEFEKPVYEKESYPYARRLVEAARDGNEPLMLLYTTLDIVNRLKQAKIPEGRIDYGITVPSGGKQVIEVKTIDSSFRLDFTTELAALGQQRAVVSLVD